MRVRRLLVLVAAVTAVGAAVVWAPAADAGPWVMYVESVRGGAIAERPPAAHREQWTLYFHEERATGTHPDRRSGDVAVDYVDCRDYMACIYRSWEGPLAPGDLSVDVLLDRATLRTTVEGCVIDIVLERDPDAEQRPPQASSEVWTTYTYDFRNMKFSGIMCGEALDGSWTSRGGGLSRSTWTYITPL